MSRPKKKPNYDANQIMKDFDTRSYFAYSLLTIKRTMYGEYNKELI